MVNEAVERHKSNLTSTTDILNMGSHSNLKFPRKRFSKVLSIFIIIRTILEVKVLQLNNTEIGELGILRSYYYKEFHIYWKKDFPSFPVIRPTTTTTITQQTKKWGSVQKGELSLSLPEWILWIANGIAMPVLPFEQRNVLKMFSENHQACNKNWFSFLV